MSQSSGPFLTSSHGPPGFTPRLPTSTSLPLLKRTTNGPMPIGNPPNTSISSNINVPASTMRPSSSIGTAKSNSIGMNPMDKSNSTSYSSRYTRKNWPMSRNATDKNIRGYEEHEHSYMRPNLPSHNAPPDALNNSSFTIEPAIDDDEGEDVIFSARHMAAARFQRNQRLLHEIFNEVCIPDLRSNISVDRIATLRRQVNALKTHRETFEKGLHELEEKHIEKKRKFLEANEKFHNEYAEASATNLNQEKISEILQKHEAMEKLQKEKQLLAQQHQQPAPTQTFVTPPPPVVPTISPSVTEPTMTKTEPVVTAEIPQQSAPAPPPPPPVQIPTNSTPSTPPSLPIVQPVTTSQSAPSQTAPHSPQQSVQSQIPISQQLAPPTATMPHASQPVITAPPPLPQQSTSVMSQNPQAISSSMMQNSQITTPPAMTQASQPTPPMMTQVPSTSVSQGYPMMHTSSAGFQQVSGYGHPQQAQQYRQPMPQRSGQYPPNVQWQQQQQQQQQSQQQQWQQAAYDSRYYHPYPPSVQWSQQQPPPPPQQQWIPNSSQQAMSVMPPQQSAQIRGPPPSHQQQPPPPQHMYHNNPHYGYGAATAGWNPNAHPPQSYSYPQNPAYDPSQQQYYPPQQMHNPPQGYEYGPPPPQQQMPPQ